MGLQRHKRLKAHTGLKRTGPPRRKANPIKRGPVSGSKRPTADQKAWHDWVRAQGCYITGQPAELHHCAGSTAKSGKQLLGYAVDVGQWFVIPLSHEAHQGPHGIAGDRSMFSGHGLGETRKEIEITIFMRLVAHFRRQFGYLPCPEDVLRAVEAWHKSDYKSIRAGRYGEDDNGE